MSSSSILWTNWGQRFRLVAFLVLGTTFAILHHLLGKYLSGKPVLKVTISGTHIDQSFVSITSNALSQVIKWLFAGTIGVAFAQHFWIATIKYHDKEYWPKLDAPLAASKGNPFTISALPTWHRTPGLAFAALMIMSMIFIPILVPGSIRVVTGELTQPCAINFPNTTKAFLSSGLLSGTNNFTVFTTSQTSAIVNSVILGGSYLQVPSPCGVCAYHVNFTAPSMTCSSDINSTYDFSTNLPPHYKDDPSWTPFWNGTLSTLTDEGYVLTVATRDGHLSYTKYVSLIPSPPAAVKCYVYRADYHVQVQHDTFSSRIDVLDVIPRYRLSPIFRADDYVDDSDLPLDGLAQAVVSALRGFIVYDSWTSEFVDTNLTVAYSSMLHWTHTNETNIATWSDLSTSLPSLMQNVSLSLLSGQFDSLHEAYMVKVDTDCSMTQLIYEYDSRRLLAIYIAAWTVAAIFLLLGFFFIWRNEREHNLDFSHIVEQLHFDYNAGS